MSEKTYELAGKAVHRVGFGAMQLGELGGREGPPSEVAEAILREAVRAGANHLDTAQFYGGGEVNRLIRAALAPYPDDLLIATKVGAVETPDGLTPAQKPAELRAQVEENLGALGLEALDLVYIRRVDRAPGLVAEGDQIVGLDSQLAELTALRGEGKVRAIGLSHVSAAQVESAIPAGIVAVQNWYGVLNRDDEPTLDLCAANGIVWVPFFPLGSAFSASPGFGAGGTSATFPRSGRSPPSSARPRRRSASPGSSPTRRTRSSSPAPPTPSTCARTSPPATWRSPPRRWRASTRSRNERRSHFPALYGEKVRTRSAGRR